MLSFTQFSKKYNGLTIIAAPELTLQPGIYWLKGINGSGKTTLMKSIAGLIPFDGQITVSGLSIVKNRASYCRSVNYAEAEPEYPPFLTGSDLIAFFYQQKQHSGPPSPLIEMLGVDKFASGEIGTYSSGMLKKLSLALAFIGSPTIVLLDEPLITLDVASVATLQLQIESLHASGVSFLITSHQEFLLQHTSVTPLIIHQQQLMMATNT